MLRKREKRGSRELKERSARKMAIAEKRAGGGRGWRRRGDRRCGGDGGLWDAKLTDQYEEVHKRGKIIYLFVFLKTIIMIMKQ